MLKAIWTSLISSEYPIENKTAFYSRIVQLLTFLLHSSILQLHEVLHSSAQGLIRFSRSTVQIYFLPSSGLFYRFTAGNIHLQDVPENICSSNLDAKQFSSHNSSILKCHEISDSTFCSKRSYFSWKSKHTFFTGYFLDWTKKSKR